MSTLNIDKRNTPYEARNKRIYTSVGVMSSESSATGEGPKNGASDVDFAAHNLNVYSALTLKNGDKTYILSVDAKGNLVATANTANAAITTNGDISFFAGSNPVSNWWDALGGHVDNQTIKFENNVLKAIVGIDVTVDNLVNYYTITQVDKLLSGAGLSNYWNKTQSDNRYALINHTHADYQPAATAWNTGNFNPTTKADLNGNYSNIFKTSVIYFGDSNTALYKGDNNSVRLGTNFGYVDIGAQNSSFCHFETDRPNFSFDKSIYVHGSILDYNTNATYYNSANLNNPLYTGNLINSSGQADAIRNCSIFSYSGAGTPFAGALLTFGGFNTGSYPTQIQGQYSGNNLAFRNRNDDSGIWNSWNVIYHTGNFNPDSKAAINGNLDNIFSANSIYLKPGQGNGINFWNSSEFFIQMGDRNNYDAYTHLETDSNNDYNLYYKCNGNNRGHGFITGNNLMTTQITNNGIYTRGWFRNYNINQGWYNQATSAGMWSTSTQHLETYNSSSLTVNSWLTATGIINSNQYFKTNSNIGLVGDYNEAGTTDKIIWTIGTSWASLAAHYGIGYTYNNIAGFGHSYFIAENGIKKIQLSGSCGHIKISGDYITKSGYRITDDGTNLAFYNPSGTLIYRLTPAGKLQIKEDIEFNCSFN